MAENNSNTTAISRLSGIKRMISAKAVEEGDKHVLTVSNGTGRSLVLNRPKALNSLTHQMVQKIKQHLSEWEESDLCSVVVLRSNSERAFCAGGDVVEVSKAWGRGEHSKAMRFFQDEYEVNHLIATYRKPIVALIDGYTMGGGVGLSVHAPFRVATESTVFAMPETKIGFVPDVGASFFLPRLDGETGIYLGLSGRQLRGRDLLYAGIATHYVPSERLPVLEQRLWELGTADYDAVNGAIEEFAAQPEEGDGPEYALAAVRGAIDRCFRFNTVEGIVEALKQEQECREWAAKTLGTLEQMSPSSLKLTLEQLRHGRTRGIRGAFELELRLAEKRLASHDMHEGIDALLVRKSKDPQWQPATLAEVDMYDLHAEYFASEVLYRPRFSKADADFMEYPHRFGLPTEGEIKAVVRGESPQSGSMALTREEVMQFFARECSGKIGVGKKVGWVLDRRTRERPDSYALEWV